MRRAGITCLLLDVDNTVFPHHSPELSKPIAEWVASLPEKGFKACLVSNNWHDDIHSRAESVGLPVVAKAGKPLPFGIRRAVRLLDADRSECAIVGDQVFTDVLGGRLAGVRTVLVDPLTPSDLPHTAMLRRLERRIIGDRRVAPRK